MRLSALFAAFTSLCTLSNGTPTSIGLTIKDTTNHESSPNALSDPILQFPPLTETEPITKRTRFSQLHWGNGWKSSSLTYCALFPILPAASQLGSFYSDIFRISSSYPPGLVASRIAIYDGVTGHLVRFVAGELEMRFFSENSMIPWGFVVSVAGRLGENTAMGFTGLHGTIFVHEVMGMVVYVTTQAAGVPVPWVRLT